MSATHRYFLGLSLGQPSDFTALAILERPHVTDRSPLSLRRPAHALRHLRRFPPGTPYPEVAAEVRELMQTPPLPGSFLAIDQTGVSAAVVQLLDEALRGNVNGLMTRVTVSAGHAVVPIGGGYLVPKKELVGNLQVLLQTRRLAVPRSLPEAETLVRELETFRVEVTAAKEEQEISWREGANDDLVLALATAAWVAERSLPMLENPPEEPLFRRLLAW